MQEKGRTVEKIKRKKNLILKLTQQVTKSILYKK